MADSPWPCFLGNAQHTGLSPYDTSDNPGKLRWKYETYDEFSSSPVIGTDGTIYIGSSYNEYLFAFNPDGTLKWKYDTGSWGVYSTPAISSDGTIYFGRQEYYEGEAEDMGAIIKLGETKTVNYGTFDNVLVIKDYTPLEPGEEEYKYYAPGIGLILEEVVDEDSEQIELISIQ